MKTIGLIGGMSWQSSLFYYKYINQLVAKQLGGAHSAKILMSSVDFSGIEKWSFENRWNDIGDRMAKEARRLQDAGADIIVLGTNTIHLTAVQIEQAITIPYLHIAKATGEAINQKQLKRVALLGTKFTMEKDFYTSILLNEHGLDVSIPNLEERGILQHIIYDELVKGKFTAEAKKKCVQIINALKAKGAEGIILGCTELPILIPENEVDLPVFDTTMIHSKAAVDFALG